MMARTKRSRRSYGAGEWGRNRVRVFPDAKTGLYQMEWRENGRRLTRSLKQRTVGSPNPGRKSSKVIQDCTICVSCRWARSDSIAHELRENRDQMAGRRRASRPANRGVETTTDEVAGDECSSAPS